MEKRINKLKNADKEELEELKEEIAHFENLILIGEMAQIIGHEIRNPMTTVRGFLQMFMKKPSLANNQEYLQLMIDELDDINAMISGILTVNKMVEGHKQYGDLNQIINSVSPLIQDIAVREGKNFEKNLKAIPGLELNIKEIRHLILKMSRNALEAMDRNGTLVISTKTEKDNVVLEIKDDGKGIDPEVLDMLGTPFLKTKDMGTGLGLFVCYNIVKRHEADIEVNSSQKGTVFTIKFKISDLDNIEVI